MAERFLSDDAKGVMCVRAVDFDALVHRFEKACARITELEADRERVDWLERAANESDGLHLHDGRPGKPFQCRGLGLRPGALVRTLREAIDTAMGYAPPKHSPTTAEPR